MLVSPIIQELLNGDTLFQNGAYTGSVEGDNRLIYGVPCNASRIAEYNPSTKTATLVGEDLGSSGGYKWWGGIPLNGFIYCCPYQAQQILRIDTSTKTTQLVGDILHGNFKYQSAVAVAQKGIIYFIPCKANRILQYDTNNGTSSFVGDSYDGSNKWNGGYYSELDQCIYFVPFNHRQVLKLDTLSGTTILIGDEFPGQRKWVSCVAGSDGSIYCPPCSASEFLKINVRTGKTSLVGKVEQPQYGFGWYGCVKSRENEGMMYMAPYCADCVLVFDMKDETSHEIGPAIQEDQNYNYMNPVISREDKCMYAFPERAKAILKIDVESFAAIYPTLKNGNVPTTCEETIANNVWLIDDIIPKSAFDSPENLNVLSKALLQGTAEANELVHKWARDPSKSHELYNLIKVDK